MSGIRAQAGSRSGPLIVIGAGGTAGHVVPAIAVANALRAERASVRFVGGDRAERELVPAAGFELDELRMVPLPRRSIAGAARAAAIDGAAVGAALRLLRRLRPDAVLGAGGYVAGPVSLAAVLLRVPLVLAEADSHIGLTNRLLAPFARRVCLAFPVDGLEGERFTVTGRPVPAVDRDRERDRAALGLGADERLLLVFGGSQGARSINEAAIAAFGRDHWRERRVRVLHAAGERDLPSLRSPGPWYELRGFLDVEQFTQALTACDLVVARSGGSIFEIAAAGRPAVLVPYPYATAGHQASNARWMQRAGAAVVIPDAELTADRLGAEVEALLGDRERLASMAAVSASLARPDAAAAIAREVLNARARG